MTSRILWRRLDLPGHEHAELSEATHGWHLAGTALVANGDVPCRLDYAIDCDAEWRTRHVRIDGSIGDRTTKLELERTAGDDWLANGVSIPALHGCVDVDLGFSPSTNLLPIRRLALAIGARAVVRAAWVRFPELTLEVLEQVYTRLGDTRYLYESAGGAFRRELTVSAEGLVLDYPELWRADAIVRDVATKNA